MKISLKALSGVLFWYVAFCSATSAADYALLDLGTVHFPDQGWQVDDKASEQGTLLAVSSRGCLLRIDALTKEGLVAADELTEEALLTAVKGIFPADSGSGRIDGLRHVSLNAHKAVTFSTTGHLPDFAEIPLQVTLTDTDSVQLSFFQLSVLKKNAVECQQESNKIIYSFMNKLKGADENLG